MGSLSIGRATAVFLALTQVVACNGVDVTNDSSTEMSRVQVSGKAVKGLIANGAVSLYGLEGNTKQLLGTTVTNSEGGYDIDVPSNYSGPIEVEISALESGSFMLCDSASGCGNVAFGEQIALPQGFSMSAVMRNVIGGQPVNLHVTPLTNMAAQWASDLGNDAQSVALANAQIADLFNLPGSFVSLEPVDVTDQEVVDNSAGGALRYGVLAAAFANFQTGQELLSNIEDAAMAFSSQNGQLFQRGSAAGSVTLDSILQNAQAVSDLIGAVAVTNDIDAVRDTLVDDVITQASGQGANVNIALNDILHASLDDADALSQVLSEANVRSYLESQIDQLSWVFTEDLRGTVEAAFLSVAQTMLTVLVYEPFYDRLASLYALQGADAPDQSAIILSTQNLHVTYNRDIGELHIFTPEGVLYQGQSVDFRVGITTIGVNGELEGDLKYELKEGSTISNASFEVEFTRDSDITFVFDEMDTLQDFYQPLITALQNAANDANQDVQYVLPSYCDASVEGDVLATIDCLLGDFLGGLDMHGTLQFAMTVTHAEDDTQSFDIDFSGYADLDLTDPSAPTVTNLELLDGHFFSPNGDKIYTFDGEKGVVLSLGNTDNALYSRFGIESEFLPEAIEYTVRAEFKDLDEYLALFDTSDLDFNFSELLTIENVISQPLSTLSSFISAITQEGALTDFANHLLTETTPKDYLNSISIEMEVPETQTRYEFGFMNNQVNVINQDGLDYAYTYNDGVITVVVNAYGADLFTLDIPEQGEVTLDVVSENISLNLADIPVEELKTIFAKLAPLAGLISDFDNDEVQFDEGGFLDRVADQIDDIVNG